MTYQEAAERIACRRSLFEFLQSVNREYQYIWYHQLIADKVQDVIEGRINKLMIFVPPQHQKSTIASRVCPAWAFGKNPDLKIIHAAYGSDLVEAFSRDIQRIIDSEFYADVFPGTRLSGSNVRTVAQKSYVRTVERFDIIDYKGMYFCAGVGGGITGKSCDLGIIDDPIRGAADANSETIRNRVWEWYLNDFRTRLHNNSRQIIIQTRWHEDDLAGRILKNETGWTVVCLPAIKEDNSNPDDPREIGEALHPEMHSLDRLNEIKNLSERVFASLYQQRPAPKEGNIFKLSWFGMFDLHEIEDLARRMRTEIIWNFVGDTAYTEKTSNDPSGFLAFTVIKGNLYIRDFQTVRLGMPELIQFCPEFARRNGMGNRSIFRIEPKASGISLIQMIRQSTAMNITKAQSPTKDKVSNANVIAPYVESGRVFLLRNAAWVDGFLHNVCTFPNATHDEAVDCLYMAINEFARARGGVTYLDSVYL